MDRWQEISRIVQAALTCDARERTAFLVDACAGDDELRRQVELLLKEQDAATIFLEAPTLEMAAGMLSDTARWPFIGRRLAHYVIIDKIGAGGMGEVYRAHDQELDRDVAIKVLPAASFDDPTARARLLREARAAAALNHPHICTIHEVGEADGQTYIAMELVEGQPLSAQLMTGPLPTVQVVRYGVQLADALAHAHARGVLHRDLKSANVIVTPDGRVKVLDFGLAKRLTATELTVAVTQSQAALTQPGSVVGTLAYIAPEQLRGQTAHTSSDIWALGVVLYEMTAGTAPFQGRTGFELSAAILNQAPSPLASHIPLALQTVILRCLDKEPSQRYQAGSEVRAALENVETTFPTYVVGLTRRRAIWLGGATAVCAVSGLAAWRLWPGSGEVRSLAVLPFQNAQGDEEIDYLCDGVTESLIRQLANMRSLKVTSLSTVLNFKGQAIDPREAGRQLALDTVLAGTLTREMGRLLITAELVDVESGTQLWSNKYDRDAADLLTVQDEIASAIMDDGLRVRLSNDERGQLLENPSTDGEAYDLYLQARYLQRRATAEDYLNARELLRRATVRDPKFALAYLALGATYGMMAVDGMERPTDAWPQTNRYARRALELDPNLREAHVIEHSRAVFFDWDWEGAARERTTLLQLASSDMDPQFLRPLALERWALGRPDEAVQLARRMRELDPLSHNLAMLEADYLGHAGQLDAAVDLYEKAIQSDPADPNPYFGLSEVLYKQRRFDEAIAARRQAHAAAGDEEFKEVLAAARGEDGYREIERARVRLELDLMKARAVVNYVSPLEFARTYAQLGEKDQAFQYLDAAFVDRSPGLVFLKVDRAWDNIRDDPRFTAAIRRVGLP